MTNLWGDVRKRIAPQSFARLGQTWVLQQVCTKLHINVHFRGKLFT